MVKIKRGFVLAAGLGTRMRHLTENMPKPMLEIAGKTMLDYAMDSLVKAGVEEIVVNTYYFSEIVEEHLTKRTDVKIIISNEDELLETGGGVKKALHYFKDEPFYVLNSDVICVDGEQDSLLAMAEMWNDEDMDLMLMLHPLTKANFYDEAGDYYMEGSFSKPIMTKRRHDGLKANYVVAEPRIVHPRLFNNTPEGKWSFFELFVKAENEGKLYGFVHKGEWFHVGTPEALEETNRIFAEKNG